MILFFQHAQQAFGILNQTQQDLALFEDDINFKFENDPDFKKNLLPMLVATPEYIWQESQKDFSPVVVSLLKRLFPGANELIECAECKTWRMQSDANQRLYLENGELSPTSLSFLQQHQKYQNAKSVIYVQETSAGVYVRIISLSDSRILYLKLADASENLTKVKPWSNYARAKASRQRGESLAYVFIHAGLYPQGLLQIEFDEQWGLYNQHISGITLSLFGPVAAVGANYHFLWPENSRAHLSGSILYPLRNLASSVTDSGGSTFVFQAMLQYNFAASYAVFVGGNTDQVFTIGLSFYNPLWLPFLL